MASRILLHSKPFDLIEKSKPLYRNVRLQAIHNNGQKGSISALQRAIWNHQQQEQSSSVASTQTAAIKVKSFATRNDLNKAQRIVVKLGSAVITREDECGLALGRLASIVEQTSQLHKEGRDVLMVTSGAVAFGKQKLSSELRLSMSIRETLAKPKNEIDAREKALLEPRAAAAVGQSGLMALYEAMFSQYGISIAQVLVNKADFSNPVSRHNLGSTLYELLRLNIIPIVNTNDAVLSPALPNLDLDGVISIQDNDSLAAHLAVEVGADALFLMSDVNGIYTKPPTQDGARLLTTYNPACHQSITFGEKSRVGLGGMESKVSSAAWALDRGVSVVICNGMDDDAISNIIAGKRVGTFFTQVEDRQISAQTMAQNARNAGRSLMSLNGAQRGEIIHRIATLLEEKIDTILDANQRDLAKANSSGTAKPLIERLALTPAKLKALSDGLRQIADSSDNVLGRTIRRTQISDDLELRQITVPLGVLMVIFESRPDCLPQIAALSIASGNGLLAKGGKEAVETNKKIAEIIREALESIAPEVKDAVALVNSREDVSELVQLEGYIDLIIPRGSNELVRSIQDQSKSIPVLGHSEGVCHVYVDKDADIDKTIKLVRDSKCDYPAACNAMETLLIHRSLVENLGTDSATENNFFVRLCNELKKENVKLFSGPQLNHLLTFGPSPAKSLKTEYGELACTIEVVSNLAEAIEHINRNGSGHTDVIITENESRAQTFLQSVDSACVFHNCSTRFSDGYRFGLGAEVGISTGRIHARGPVGIEGLLTTKWQLFGDGQTVQEFSRGILKYKHLPIPIHNETINSDSESDMKLHNEL